MSKEKGTKQKIKKKEGVNNRELRSTIKTTITWVVTSAGVALGLVTLLGLSAFGYAKLYDHRIYPGVRAWGVRLNGLTENEARVELNKRIDGALKDGLRFSYKERDITLDATTVSEDPDVSTDLIRYDIEQTVKNAMNFGRSSSLLPNIVTIWSARIYPRDIGTAPTINNERTRESIEHAASDTLQQPENAGFEITWTDTTPKITVHESKDGTILILDSALAQLESQAKKLTFSPIPLLDKASDAELKTSDVFPLVDTATLWLSSAPITLTTETDNIEISAKTFASWIKPIKKDGTPLLTIDAEKFHTDIRAKTSIEQERKKGSFKIEDGKIASFEAGKSGVRIDDEATIKGITDGIRSSSSTFPIITHIEEAVIEGSDAQSMGIKEIIGTGTSNFSGSPSNRQKNIAIGVSRVNGTLIAPGEEFSLLKTLGPITAEYGWLPELVIKGNKTLPEVGGGLCQIGTTTFRAALDSGLKILERRNHSYRVSYYEPAGTDATIYDPSPDFRFLNDTSHHVYINAYITGTIITYEFWGTKDGREITVAPPRIYNIVAAPPTKLIETLDLEPGKKKCTESAHAGADASLDYKVVYTDGTVHEETFNSHYKPWGAVCLIGVEKLTETTTDAGTATSTQE